MQDLLPFETGIRQKSIQSSLEDFQELKSPEEYDIALGILDATRIKISHIFDKLSSLSNSRTRLLPHQIEATYRVSNALKPRFILADEVGLGKTVEAGLIIKELMLRKGFSRVLVAVPATLMVQWQQEMKNKFNEDFIILSRKNFHQISGNWTRYKKIITSIDFIKNDKYSESVLKYRWDIAVFDEAHRLRRDYSKVTRAYAFAEKIAQKTSAVLLLSATPFRGKLEELFYLIRLVDQHLLGPHSAFLEEFGKENAFKLKDKISRVLIRRRKVEVGGFTKRFATTIRFELSPDERNFYDATTEYVKREYNLAMQEKNRAAGFVMIVFQRLLDSSTRALLRALERRRQKLETQLHQTSQFLENNDFDFDFEQLDDMEIPEDGFESILEEKAKSLKEIRKEILILNHLCLLGRGIQQDKKLVKLKETLYRLRKKGHKKFIIFTQFRTTQDYIAENLQDFLVTLFHGSLSVQQKEDAVLEFKEKTEVFICTEAGGEGRNLQFGNVLVNYDLPWSPLKIEQRIGRIHRFGQANDVYIFNFSTRDTVAERVLEVLEDKIRLFEESIGPSDALLGAIEDENIFQNKFMQFITGKKTKKEFNQELNEMLKLADTGYTRLNELVSPQMVDFNLDDYYRHTKKDRSLDNDNIEKVTLSYLKLQEDERFSLRKIIDRNFPGRFSEYLLTDRFTDSEKTATFRSEAALENESCEFLAAGHPLVENALQYFLRHDIKKSIIRLPSEGRFKKGYYFIFLVQYINGLDRSDLLSCLIPDDPNTEVEIPDELLIPPGFRCDDLFANRSPFLFPDMDRKELIRTCEYAESMIQKEAEKRSQDLQVRLHSVFKKEEYKIEISYGKKIRQLDEKRDRHKLRYRMNPTVENRALLSRTENEFRRTSDEMQAALEKMKRESRISVMLNVMQIYRFD
ncbi:MAG: SNF2-related protein [Spirochaetia bacterium]|nr:SNF2-related protein [Spirochaetia bacterium]